MALEQGVTLLKTKSFLLSYGFLTFMVLVFAFYSIAAKNFLSISNIMSILHAASALAVLACGLGIVVLTGKLDISIGSTAYLSAAVGIMLITRMGWPLALCIPLVLVCGAIIGALNGFVVTVLKVNPVITTLGTMIALRGLALQLTNSQVIGLPESLRAFGIARIGPFFLDTAIVLIILIAMHVVHTRTVFGRNITAVGNGEEVAARLGIRVRKINFSVFVLSGMLAGIGGFLLMCQVGALNSYLGSGMEFTAVAAVIIGGISLFGGEGTIVPGIILGVCTLNVVENGLNLIGASPFAYPFVRGAVIFMAMYADSLKLRARSTVRITT